MAMAAVASPEISWPQCSVSLAPRLQLGENGRTKSRSRFNGFGAGWQTVETVRSGLVPYCTKASVLMRGRVECEICELAPCSAVPQVGPSCAVALLRRRDAPVAVPGCARLGSRAHLVTAHGPRTVSVRSMSARWGGLQNVSAFCLAMRCEPGRARLARL